MDGPGPGEGSGGSGNPTKGPTPTNGRKAGSADNQTIKEPELFKSAVEHFRFVTTMFWQQAGFFLLIQSALLAVVSQSLPEAEAERVPLLVISALGLILALFWAWVAWKRFKIVEDWRSKVVRLDQSLDPHHLLYRSLDEQPLRRPTAVTRFLPLILAIGWVVLFIIFWLPTPSANQHAKSALH